MTIRIATAGDINCIQQLYWELDADAAAFQPEHFVQAPRPEAYLLEIIAGEHSDFIVADVDGCVIGFALVMERETGGISCLVALPIRLYPGFRRGRGPSQPRLRHGPVSGGAVLGPVSRSGLFAAIGLSAERGRPPLLCAAGSARQHDHHGVRAVGHGHAIGNTSADGTYAARREFHDRGTHL